MQQLLHDAISGGQHCCQGLLAGDGNMIEKRLPVTELSHSDDPAMRDFLHHQPLFGIYISTCGTCAEDIARMRKLAERIQKHHDCRPACYLLLELGHKGRVDALLFADAEFRTPIPLNLKEDGDLYPAAVNR